MAQRLIRGCARDPFLPRLLAAIRQANEIDLAVAFIKQSGLDLLFEALSDAIELRDARLRVLTSGYLDVTDPQALRRLLLLAELGAEIRLFEAEDHSFHLKAYICVRTDQGHALWGSAFIGSSNISRTALTDGLEWNIQVDHPEEPTDPAARHFQEIRDELQHLFDHGNTRDLDHDWIDDYEARRRVQRLPIPRIWDEPEQPAPEPTQVQAEVLAALAETRAAGHGRGLVVMATGLGKTYLAAFDSEAMGAKRVLFVAHREEILLQVESNKEGIRLAAVYRGSTLDRGEALEQLGRGDLQVLFSVDLFNEGVNLPAIDTVVMLRPTESKILFLQQLGRGLRGHPDKERLLVLDFIGNHKGFLNKPDALFDCGKRYRDLADFA